MGSLFALIESRMPQDRSRVLLETETGRNLTWQDLDDYTARYADFMSELGLAKGDRVAVQVEKSPEALFLYLACLRAGLIYLPMNTAYQRDEVDYIVGNAQPSLVVCQPEKEGLIREIISSHGVRHLFTLGAHREGTWVSSADNPEARFPTQPCEPSDVACIVYTSGTTGKPKGAMLTHGNLSSNALALVQLWGFTSQDTLIHALPIFHVHGLFVANHTVLLSGAKMHWLPKFDERIVMGLMPSSTVLMGVPTFYTRLLSQKDFNREVCRGMRLFVSGSAPLLEETFREFERRTGHRILERYGMTETGMNASNPLEGERRGGSVGFPVPGVSIRISGDGDSILGPDEVGVIQVKGPNVFPGYWRMPEKNADDFTSDGWFRTGDLGKIDRDGYVSIVGRAKDLIITGGYNVYPKEVESVIDQIPGVVESAVIGVSHPDFGEAVTAIVKKEASRPELGEADVIAHVKSRIANYKVPKRVHFVEELPRNAMGKVQKNLLRGKYSSGV